VLREVMTSHPLLPGSVTGGAANDSLLLISVADATGREWFNSARDSASDNTSPYAGEAALEGVGAPLLVRATLRASAPEQLLVGRPPRSRLPVLLGLLALTAALAVVAAMQLRREHELAKLRADFTSSVSHELRTPLAQILLFGETLKLGRVRSEEDRRLAIDTIVHEARRLMHMVDNVLRFARTTEGRMRLEPAPTELSSLIESIAATFAPLAAEWGARVVTDIREPVTAVVDAGALRQIVLNLLDNALKFGPPGQTVSIILERAGDRARIAVEDAGPGIPPADRERIWSPYVRLGRERSAAHEGSGIGLAVVRELVELHGGVARVEDASGGGARFVAELPVAAERVSPERSAPAALVRRDRARVRHGWTTRGRRRSLVDPESPAGQP
jgi:signal transduction histidine kinase